MKRAERVNARVWTGYFELPWTLGALSVVRGVFSACRPRVRRQITNDDNDDIGAIDTRANPADCPP